MKVDLTRLINSFTDKVEIDEIISFDNNFIQTTDIRKLDDIRINGMIGKSECDIYNLHLSVSGKMILPCALSLNDVIYPFTIEISEILSDMEEAENYLKINGNYIDILPIIWQYIILEIPSRVISEDCYQATVVGDGWKLITEEIKITESKK